jgi:SAM-dependent methyltransferase
MVAPLAVRGGLEGVQEMTDHVQLNRQLWDGEARHWVKRGREDWARAEPTWGTWYVPESELQLLTDLDGKDAVELGCGTAYVSSWMARRGARVVGIDISREQLNTARTLQREFDLDFPLIHADAEHAPFKSGSFDFAISEYGAAIWCDPYNWIPEAARLLRPGGRLSFMSNGILLMLTTPELEAEGPAREHFLRPYFGMRRFEWTDFPSVEFCIPHGEMIRLLRSSGFEIEDLVEIQPAEGATTSHPKIATLEWARKWPTEELWRVRKKKTTRKK